MAKPIEKLAVRRVLELALDEGDLHASTGMLDAARGLAIHRHFQSLTPQGAEMPLKMRIEGKQLILDISGRADAVVTEKGIPVVFEYKTSTHLPDTPKVVDIAQARFYAYLLSRQENHAKIIVRVFCLDAMTGESRIFEELHTPKTLEDFATPILQRLLMRREAAYARRMQTHFSAQKLPLPYPKLRQGQQDMMDATLSALLSGATLLCQAPTGIGKTMGALFPAAKLFAQDEMPERIFYLTCKGTARLAAIEALRHLQQAGLAASVCIISAKESCCKQGPDGCLGKACSYAIGYYERCGNAIEEVLESTMLFDAKTIGQLAEKYHLCPFEFSLDLSMHCSFVLCDVNYAFAPRFRLQRHFSSSLPRKRQAHLLIDEAHNLVDRARDMYSALLFKQDILLLRQICVDLEAYPEAAHALGSLNAFFVGFLREMEAANLKIQAIESAPHGLLQRLERAQKTVEELRLHPLFPPEHLPLADSLNQSLQDALYAVEHFDKGYRGYFRNDDGFSMHLLCADPSWHLQQVIDHTRGAVLFSATLSPSGYFARMLCPSAHHIELPCPFPPEHRLVLLDEKTKTTFAQRQAGFAHIAAQLSAMVQGKIGNYLAFFPSFAYLRGVMAYLSSADFTVFSQQSGMKERERQNFLSHFVEAPKKSALGLAVMGGIFGEGVDLMGDRLIGVAVVGVGWPSLSPERETIRNYFDEGDGEGLLQAYIHPGMHRVLQAAGRLIRSEKDKGVLLLLDERFAQPPYVHLLPLDWQINPSTSPHQVLTLSQQFWSRQI